MTDEEFANYNVLVGGVPPWMREPLVNWVMSILGDGSWVRRSICSDIEVRLRISLGLEPDERERTHVTSVRDVLNRFDDLVLLRVVDYLLSLGAAAGPLDHLLERAKSKWQIGERLDSPGLVARVPEGVQNVIEGTIASSGSAGQVLARAWAAVHGLEPNPGQAYSDAVKAVEIAAIPVVQPNHDRATLGTVIGQMKADGDWRLDLREYPDARGPVVVVGMLKTLWNGQGDRHGSASYVDATQEQASVAVVLAATLVNWFTLGAVQRRPAS